jgi:hypothetical protein
MKRNFPSALRPAPHSETCVRFALPRRDVRNGPWLLPQRGALRVGGDRARCNEQQERLSGLVGLLLRFCFFGRSGLIAREVSEFPNAG